MPTRRMLRKRWVWSGEKAKGKGCVGKVVGVVRNIHTDIILRGIREM